MNTTDTISVGALIISGFSLAYSMYTNHKQKGINKNQDDLNKLYLAREKEVEKKKDYAEVTAKIYNVDSQHWKIKIANIGEGVAKNVSYSFKGENKWDIFNSDLFPLATFDPKSSIELKPLIYIGSPDKCTLTIYWEDVRGKQEKDYLLPL